MWWERTPNILLFNFFLSSAVCIFPGRGADFDDPFPSAKVFLIRHLRCLASFFSTSMLPWRMCPAQCLDWRLDGLNKWSPENHRLPSRDLEDANTLALFKSPSGGGLTKMGSVTFWGPLGTSFLFTQIVGAAVTSENKCVWAPKPCIMRSFGLKMRQKKVRETFRKVCQTCFCTIIAVCCRDF